ncbi:MAG: hypothetical protein RL398_41 [Planctomycetota bacterium]
MVLFCHVTSRVETDKHQGLLQEKGGRGFPYLVFMDADGNVTAKQGERTVAGFEKTRGNLVAFADLEAKFKKGDKAAGVDALIAGMELGRYTAEDAKAMLPKLGKIPADKQAKIDGMLVNSEVDALMANVRTKEQAAEVGRKFAEMDKAGKVPSGRAALSFYSIMLETHEADKDAKAFEATLEKLKKLVEGERNADRVIKRYEATLEKLKNG